ncbi:hypothetical protein [Campylobacter vicugnae]|uniref:hypothetical protein n=1 Tax=Campylobacter vicugnae TaxID=1660076 RepID=UPI002549CF09|nr:hypothetical protein [Campylobacter ovis]MDL0105224.1 hypothetical protein [Campylobacter ovis]MDL0106643.1 hypothetical protein [Campylobacter ovis]
MAVKMLTVIINDPQGQMSKEQVEQAVISTLNSRRASDSSTDYMADTFIVRTKEQFYVVDDKFKQTLNASSNILQSDYITSKQLEEKLAQLKVSEDNDDAVVINPEGITLAKAQELLALKLDKSSYEIDKATFATKDEVYNKSEVDNKIATVSAGGSVNLDGYATKAELNNKVTQSIIVDKGEARIENEVTGGGAKFLGKTYNSFAGVNDGADDVYALMYARDKAKLGTRVWLNPNGAYYSKNSSTYESIEDNEIVTKSSLKQAINDISMQGTSVDIDKAIVENSTIKEISSKLSNIATNLQGATYEQIVATLKYAGLELPKTLAAHQNFNAFGDDRLNGDTTITLTPIKYAGSYGQAWERVAIYNEADEMLIAKYATISSDKLSVDVIYVKDGHSSNDGIADIPENYELLDGEVRGKVVLGAVDYHGDEKTILNHFATSGQYTEIFLGITHNYNDWSFTFYDYKPSKFSVRNGTETYGGYGHMTKYSLKLEIGDWSKEFVYENSKAVNDIVVDFKDLALGSDEKLIELAKAWNIPLTAYNFYDDILTAKGVLLSSDLSGQNENFRPNQSAITLNTTKESIEVSADINSLLEYPSSNEAQGTGKWIGIGIDTGKPSILGVSVDDYALQQSDIDEAKAVGLNNGSFVFWFKAEQDYTRELVLRSGELERSVSIIFKNTSES